MEENTAEITTQSTEETTTENTGAPAPEPSSEPAPASPAEQQKVTEKVPEKSPGKTQSKSDAILEKLAQEQGFTSVDEYIDEVDKFLANKRYAEQAENIKAGKTIDEVAVEAAKMKEKADAYDKQQSESARFIRELREFQAAFPGEKLSAEAGEYRKKGYSLIDSHKLAQFDAQEKERRVAKSNEKNAQASTGSLSGGAAEEAELTEEQIKSMSPYELAKPSVWAKVSKKLFRSNKK